MGTDRRFGGRGGSSFVVAPAPAAEKSARVIRRAIWAPSKGCQALGLFDVGW